MNFSGHRKLLIRVASLSVVVFSVASCGKGDSVESPATVESDSESLPMTVVEHFEKHFAELQSESGEQLPGATVNHETKDMDNDGKQELFLYNSYLCGSSGCTGPVYSEKSEDGSYCFVAMGHSTDFADELIVLEPLDCRDYENDEVVHLSEMKKFVRSD